MKVGVKFIFTSDSFREVSDGWWCVVTKHSPTITIIENKYPLKISHFENYFYEINLGDVMSFSQSLNGNCKKKIISRFLQWQLSVNLSIGVSIFGHPTDRAVRVTEYILLVPQPPNT